MRPSSFAGKLFGSYCLPFSMTAVSVGWIAAGSFPLDVFVLPCVASLWSGWASRRLTKRLVVFPPLHIIAFLHVLHTGLCSSPETGIPSSAVRPKYTHTILLAFFFLTKVAGKSAISLQMKGSRLHVASCLVTCRVASPIFSSVSVWYILWYDNLPSKLLLLYWDTSISPTPSSTPIWNGLQSLASYSNDLSKYSKCLSPSAILFRLPLIAMTDEIFAA